MSARIRVNGMKAESPMPESSKTDSENAKWHAILHTTSEKHQQRLCIAQRYSIRTHTHITGGRDRERKKVQWRAHRGCFRGASPSHAYDCDAWPANLHRTGETLWAAREMASHWNKSGKRRWPSLSCTTRLVQPGCAVRGRQKERERQRQR